MLAKTDPAAMNDFNRLLIDHYRDTGGRLSGVFAGAPMLVLTTVGMKSARAHTVPLSYVPHPDGDGWVVAVAKSGSPTNPAWYANLRAAGNVATVEVGAGRFDVRAEVTAGAERIELQRRLVEVWPMQADYQADTTREIPILILRRTS
ncbi:nitroreductase/quinone reductase family protein [Nocardia sp. CA-107356]|uniref:nitroreductase/quinone reductase family protein n=1 Tax=Nocardia sp. CA-107356 TaxID=3239972 RepID=UPI003D919624